MEFKGISIKEDLKTKKHDFNVKKVRQKTGRLC